MLADGAEVAFNLYEVTMIWDGRPCRVPVAEANAESLLGMELLHGFELIIKVVDGVDVLIRPLDSV
jgi:predicted aspartyl protease